MSTFSLADLEGARLSFPLPQSVVIFIFMQFSAKMMPNNRLVSPRVEAPPLGNPRSVPAFPRGFAQVQQIYTQHRHILSQTVRILCTGWWKVWIFVNLLIFIKFNIFQIFFQVAAIKKRASANNQINTKVLEFLSIVTVFELNRDKKFIVNQLNNYLLCWLEFWFFVMFYSY